MKKIAAIAIILLFAALAAAQDNVYEIRSAQYPAGSAIKLVWKSSIDSTAVAKDMGTWQRDSLYQLVVRERDGLYEYLLEWYRKTMQLLDPALYQKLTTPPPPLVPDKKKTGKTRN
jgi:hypothetical protein